MSAMGAQLPGPVEAASAPEVQKRRKVALHIVIVELHTLSTASKPVFHPLFAFFRIFF
jgi:hypothetical protein